MEEADSNPIPPSGGELTGSDNDDESDDDGVGSTEESPSVLSADEALSDGEDSGSDIVKPSVGFRLREILFYDDKITIFKARHGVL